MKRFTLLLLTVMMTVLAQAAGPAKNLTFEKFLPAKANVKPVAMANVKQAPISLAKKQVAAKAR